MITFCIRTIRVGSFSSGIWKYTVGRNCDGVRGGSACDHAAAASMPEARMATGMISLFMEDLPGLAATVDIAWRRPWTCNRSLDCQLVQIQDIVAAIEKADFVRPPGQAGCQGSGPWGDIATIRT